MRNQARWIVSLVIVGFAVTALAQAPTRPSTPASVAPPATAGAVGGQASGMDEQIAACLYACSRNEIEICKFVKDKLKTSEAREFAEMMINDHTPAAERLQKFAGNLATKSAGSNTRETATPERTDATALSALGTGGNAAY